MCAQMLAPCAIQYGDGLGPACEAVQHVHAAIGETYEVYVYFVKTSI